MSVLLEHKKTLTFTLCKERRQYGELIRPEPSRFLYELPQDDLHWDTNKKSVKCSKKTKKRAKGVAGLKAMLGET